MNKILIVMLAAVLTACGSQDKKDDDSKPMTLNIIHINDHHSHLESDKFSFNTSGLSLKTKTANNKNIAKVSVEFGGFPMMASLFDKLVADNSNTLKLHAGDAITGTFYYSLFKGEADAALMNEICFDAFALGNHEFDDGDAGLAKFLNYLKADKNCKTPVLAANVVPGKNSPIKTDYIQPYTIIERDGQKIGIIGIDIAEKTKNSSRPDADTRFLDETTTSQKYIDELKGKGINKIILMTHYQYENDKKLAAALKDVDVIVGGDSHSLLGGKTFKTLGFNTVGAYPTEVKNKNGDKVCIVQAWEYAHIVGHLKVKFDGDGKVSQCSGIPYLPVSNAFVYEHKAKTKTERAVKKTLAGEDSQAVEARLKTYKEIAVVSEDAAMAAKLKSFSDQTTELKKTVITTVSEDLCLERIPGQGRSKVCPGNSLNVRGSDISNIIAKAFLEVTPTAAIAIQNGGGVRVDVPKGDLTIAKAFEVLPFSNTLVTLRLTGQQIKNTLEEALENALKDGGSTGAYPYASALRYDVDASKTKGNRVSKLQVNPRLKGSWTAIDLTKSYVVVTNDYIAGGKDGYATFGEIFKDKTKVVDTYTEYAQGFIDYAKALKKAGKQLKKLPEAEYSTQNYIGRDGCNHGTISSCTGY